MGLHVLIRWSFFLGLMVWLVIVGSGGVPVSAQTRQSDIDALKKEVEELRRREAERQQQLQNLQQRLDQLQSQPAPVPSGQAPAAAQPAPAGPAETPATALDRALQGIGAQPQQPAQPALLTRQIGRGATLRLIDISGDILVAAGGSTVNNDVLEVLQAGDHDPRQNGFTLQAMELSLGGAIDPYFTGEAHIVFFIDREGETRLELEEAFVTTQSLPFGLQAKGGFFFTEFGLINPTHPHAWDWVDQPVILSRLFGEDGLRQAGLRVSWLAPLPWFSQLFGSVQNATGETAVSFLANDEVFEARPIGGRPFVEHDLDGPEDFVWLARWVNAWNLGASLTSQLGLSALFGPNSTGSKGRTLIYGADLKVLWRPARHFRGWPFVRWQTEFLQRDYTAAAFQGVLPGEGGENGVAVDLPRQTLRDWGVYSQVLYGFSYRWAAGLRFEYASGSGQNVLTDGGRDGDPFRSDRTRWSPLLAWYASEFARLRLQYNYDRADHLSSDDAHSVWLVLEALFGAHPAHRF